MTDLYIFSLYTPIGQGEVFLKNELDFWLDCNSVKVTVVPTKISVDGTISVPEYVDVSLSEMLLKRKNKKISLLFKPLTLIKCFKSIPVKHIFKLGAIRETVDALTEQEITKDWLRKIPKKDNVVFYSFWLTNSILSIANELKNENVKVISRTHRFDLYDYTQKYNFFPFRKELISNLDLLMPASNDALTYLLKKYENRLNIKLKKLGVNIPSQFILQKNINGFRLVSCSYIKKVKRVELIAERLIHFAISNPKHQFEWIHFGKGELQDKVYSVLNKKPGNLKYTIHDFTPNKKLLAFYENNWVDVFINLSSSEGQPVSIMEAMSYGIPCVATDTGGVKGLINNDTGVLLDVNHEFNEFEIGLNQILNKKVPNRHKIRDFIKENNSIKNQFIEVYNEIKD